LKIWLNNLKQRIFGNWHIKAIALSSSLFIFIFYRLSTQQEILVPLSVKLPMGYEIANEVPQNIHVILRATKLPEHLSKDSFKATVDLSAFTTEGWVEGKVFLQRLGEVANVGSIEYEIQPQEIMFLLETVSEKYVRINSQQILQGNVPYGYGIQRFTFSPEYFILRGPKSRVEKITEVTVSPFDITGKTGALSASLPVFTNDKLVKTINASEVKITVQIAEKVETRRYESIALKLINLKDELMPITLDKGQVEVEGPVLVLDQLSSTSFSMLVDAKDIQRGGEYSLAVKEIQAPPQVTVLSYQPQVVKIKIQTR